MLKDYKGFFKNCQDKSWISIPTRHSYSRQKHDFPKTSQFVFFGGGQTPLDSSASTRQYERTQSQFYSHLQKSSYELLFVNLSFFRPVSEKHFSEEFGRPGRTSLGLTKSLGTPLLGNKSEGGVSPTGVLYPWARWGWGPGQIPELLGRRRNRRIFLKKVKRFLMMKHTQKRDWELLSTAYFMDLRCAKKNTNTKHKKHHDF